MSVQVAQVQRHPLAAQAAELLLTPIGAGEWPLGHRLPGETTLAAQLGVGRSTLREAIRELSGKSVLETRQLPSESADHAAHETPADAIADRNPTAAALSSRTHLTSLKETLT